MTATPPQGEDDDVSRPAISIGSIYERDSVLIFSTTAFAITTISSASSGAAAITGATYGAPAGFVWSIRDNPYHLPCGRDRWEWCRWAF
ncbi:hypothetical protein [Methanogenium organophilum]|uniref:Uncharacterized protein n=1 Tax=Methanogenium organophilum TaxID=2199 RepID=A0A9X9S5V8_METOG|nr:hypothetical protein [Methanogenium organophilum]WAI02524.1 hypothetical protein OU421_06515 [Methanogenium organophilum]